MTRPSVNGRPFHKVILTYSSELEKIRGVSLQRTERGGAPMRATEAFPWSATFKNDGDVIYSGSAERVGVDERGSRLSNPRYYTRFKRQNL